ncbi:MAG: hypothetical protein ACO1OB_09000 [Archangium sp.]
MKIYVAGEGRHEVGKWEEEPERWATTDRTDGVLFALFTKSGRVGEVIAGKNWRSIKKFKAGDNATPEQKTLKGLALDAKEHGADVVLWARDSDGQSHRDKELAPAQEELRVTYAGTLTICGGVVTPAIEAWMIALSKTHPDPESLTTSRCEQLAAQHGFAREDQMVDLVSERELDASASPSLKNWLKQLELIPADK